MQFESKKLCDTLLFFKSESETHFNKKVLDLPEIVYAVLSFLSKLSSKQCKLVNKLWLQNFRHQIKKITIEKTFQLIPEIQNYDEDYPNVRELCITINNINKECNSSSWSRFFKSNTEFSNRISIMSLKNGSEQCYTKNLFHHFQNIEFLKMKPQYSNSNLLPKFIPNSVKNIEILLDDSRTSCKKSLQQIRDIDFEIVEKLVLVRNLKLSSGTNTIATPYFLLCADQLYKNVGNVIPKEKLECQVRLYYKDMNHKKEFLKFYNQLTAPENIKLVWFAHRKVENTKTLGTKKTIK